MGGVVALTGVCYGLRIELSSTWVVGILSIAIILPISKVFLYLLHHSDSNKKRLVRQCLSRRHASSEKDVTDTETAKPPSSTSLGIGKDTMPTYSQTCRHATLMSCVVLMMVFSFVGMVFALRLGNNEDGVMSSWLLAVVQGQAIDGFLVERYSFYSF